MHSLAPRLWAAAVGGWRANNWILRRVVIYPQRDHPKPPDIHQPWSLSFCLGTAGSASKHRNSFVPEFARWKANPTHDAAACVLQQNGMQGYGGACQSYDANTPYLV